MRIEVGSFKLKKQTKHPNEIIAQIKKDPVEGPKFKAFEERCTLYFQQVYEDSSKDLNVEDFKIFDSWWNGGLLDWDNVFKNHRSAYNAIHYAIGAGCG